MITVPGLIIFIFVLGLFSNKTKNKLNFFFIALLVTFFSSMPILSKLLSLPIISIAKKVKDETISNVDAVVILTGVIYKDLKGRWQPSNTENRIHQTELFLKKYNVPLIISGYTKNNAPSEAEITKIKITI